MPPLTPTTKRRLMLVAALCGGLALAPGQPLHARSERPNILWLTSEDNGPHLGAYGDAYADTPNLDRLAARGLLYRFAWSNAPVCAPARTTIISGLYPTSTGSQHMRSMTRLPDGFRMFPQYLREAGYYVTNNAKEDYNLEKPGQVWDDSSRTAHWKNRPARTPFFAVFNFTVSHESQIRRRPHTPIHDPAKVRVPAYHPDTPEVRRDWAQYYDKVTEMDAQVGARLRELEASGLADDTIIFYWGDHGPGLPRSKRTPLDAGLRVPLIVAIPARFRHLAPPDYRPGGETKRLVGFIDLAPSVLRLAGIEPPGHFQGTAFLGERVGNGPDYLFGFRGRMDERYDMVRSARDERYVYLRNYYPHRAHGEHVAYLFQTPTTRVWRRLYDEGRLTPEQASFWQTRPAEELYDLASDPDEVLNLAESADHGAVLKRFRDALSRHLNEVRDLGFLPESEIYSRAAQAGVTPWEYGHSRSYRLAEIREIAELASRPRRQTPEDLSILREGLTNPDSAVRAWAALGLLARGAPAVQGAAAELRRALGDSAPTVRTRAAEALVTFGTEADLGPALDALLEAASLDRHTLFEVVLALNSLDAVDAHARGIRQAIASLPRTRDDVPSRYASYVPSLLDKILADLEDG